MCFLMRRERCFFTSDLREGIIAAPASVAYLKGARLEQSNGQLKARKRFLLLLRQAYARSGCRAVLGHKSLPPQNDYCDLEFNFGRLSRYER
jgi:hypothetical protein